jgi:hypothetical protein
LSRRATRLEAKYGGGLSGGGAQDDSQDGSEDAAAKKRPKCSNDEDMFDLEDDSFIDDSELVAQIEQRDESFATRTKHGGFFVSTGELQVEPPTQEATPKPQPKSKSSVAPPPPKAPKVGGGGAAKREAKTVAVRADAKQKAEAAEQLEAASFAALATLVAAQRAATAWDAKWAAWEATAVAAASLAGVAAPDAEGPPSKGLKPPPGFRWTDALSRSLLGAASAQDAAREARKAHKATAKGAAAGDHELSAKAEKDAFLAAVSALWPRGSMPLKKLHAKLGAERKRQESLASEAVLAAAAACPLAGATAAITATGEKSAGALETPPPPSRQQVLAKGIVFPEVVFPAAGLVVGERALLPGFDFA